MIRCIARLRPKLAVIPGATLFLRAYQDITVGGRISSSQYQYTFPAKISPTFCNGRLASKR